MDKLIYYNIINYNNNFVQRIKGDCKPFDYFTVSSRGN